MYVQLVIIFSVIDFLCLPYLSVGYYLSVVFYHLCFYHPLACYKILDLLPLFSEFLSELLVVLIINTLYFAFKLLNNLEIHLTAYKYNSGEDGI